MFVWALVVIFFGVGIPMVVLPLFFMGEEGEEGMRAFLDRNNGIFRAYITSMIVLALGLMTSPWWVILGALVVALVAYWIVRFRGYSKS